MNILRKILKAFLAPSDEYAASMRHARADINEQKRQEYLAHKEQMKSIRQKRADREIKSGIVIDPGGTCLCRICGKGVSAMYDHCDNCNATLNWNV